MFFFCISVEKRWLSFVITFCLPLLVLLDTFYKGYCQCTCICMHNAHYFFLISHNNFKLQLWNIPTWLRPNILLLLLLFLNFVVTLRLLHYQAAIKEQRQSKTIKWSLLRTFRNRKRNVISIFPWLFLTMVICIPSDVRENTFLFHFSLFLDEI